MAETDVSLVLAAREALDVGNVHRALKLLDAFIETNPQVKETTLEARCDAGRDALREDYWNDVRGVASDIASQWKSGDFDGDRDAVIEGIEQACDGHSRVIYTSDAILTLLFSDNDEAYTQISDEIPTQGGAVNWSALAHFAFLEDVKEMMSSEGVDLGEDPPNEGDKLCPKCETYQPGDTFDLKQCASCSEEAGNARCDECETWNIAEEIRDGKCEDCHETSVPEGPQR